MCRSFFWNYEDANDESRRQGDQPEKHGNQRAPDEAPASAGLVEKHRDELGLHKRDTGWCCRSGFFNLPAGAFKPARRQNDFCLNRRNDITIALGLAFLILQSSIRSQLSACALLGPGCSDFTVNLRRRRLLAALAPPQGRCFAGAGGVNGS